MRNEGKRTAVRAGSEVVPVPAAVTLMPTDPATDPGGAIGEVLPRPKDLWAWNADAVGRVLWRISEGETVEKAVRGEGIAWGSWFYWMMRLPEVERMHRTARRIAAFRHFDKAQEQIDRLVENADSLGGNAVRAISEAQKALRDMAAVLNPSEFGERKEQTPPVMVRIETTLNLQPSGMAPAVDGNVYEIPEQAAQRRGSKVKAAGTGVAQTFTREVAAVEVAVSDDDR